nr:hypothetical protein [Tanacetum cinerariifolium]
MLMPFSFGVDAVEDFKEYTPRNYYCWLKTYCCWKNELKAHEAIEKRFGRNKETKKVHKTILKQQHENITGLSSESLDQIHDRLQKLISQLEILRESLSQEYNNLKFLRSLPTDTNELVSVVASVSAASTKVPISAFPNVNTLSDAVIYSFFTSQSNSPQLDNDDLKQIDADDLDEMDLKWQMAMLNMRAKSVMVLKAMIKAFRQKKNRLTIPSWHSPPQVLPVLIMRKSQFDVIFYKTGLESVEAKILVYQQNETIFEEDIKLLKLDVKLRDNALVNLRKKFKKAEQERDELKFKFDKFQTFSKNLSQLLASQTNDKIGLGYDNQVFNSFVFDCDKMFSFDSDISMLASPVYDRYKSGEGYHVVPPPYTGTFMPPKPDLVCHDAPTVNETVPTAFNVSDSKDESEGEPMPTQKAPSFVQTTEHVKSPRPSVKTIKHPIPADNLRKDIPKSKGHSNSRNRKACFVCKSLTHLIKDCDYYEKKMVQKPVRNHAIRGNHHHSTRMTNLNPQRHVVPTTVLTRSRLVPLNAARPVNTAVPQTKVTRPRPAKTVVTKSHSPLKRPINHRPSPNPSTFPQKVTTIKAPKVIAVKGAKTVITKTNSPPRRHINHSPSHKPNTFPLKVTAVKAPMVNAAKGV